MKLVLSRKGFDSGAGGVASPIFPDGTMYSIPIQARGAVRSYREIGKGNELRKNTLGCVVEDLTGGRIDGGQLAHLDPDLDPSALPRRPGWRPCFEQTGAAQRHLEACGIGVGDLFLYFGWFRRVARGPAGRWGFERTSPNLHLIFGWLQVGEVIRIDAIGAPSLVAGRPWLEDHPHVHFDRDPRNVVYIAADRLVLPGLGDVGLPGAGELDRFDDRLVLTAPDAARRSLWACHPGSRRTSEAA